MLRSQLVDPLEVEQYQRPQLWGGARSMSIIVKACCVLSGNTGTGHILKPTDGKQLYLYQ